MSLEPPAIIRQQVKPSPSICYVTPLVKSGQTVAPHIGHPRQKNPPIVNAWIDQLHKSRSPIQYVMSYLQQTICHIHVTYFKTQVRLPKVQSQSHPNPHHHQVQHNSTPYLAMHTESLGGGTHKKRQISIDIDAEYIRPLNNNHISTWIPFIRSIIDRVHYNNNTNTIDRYHHSLPADPHHQHDLINHVSPQQLSTIKSFCYLPSKQPIL